MADEYTLRGGIQYRADGYAYCDRCGAVPIVNGKCLACDVQPTEADTALADKIGRNCFHPRRNIGLRAVEYERFDSDMAARIIAAMK